MQVEFFRHNINEEDIARVNEVLRSVFLTTGDTVKGFEEQLQKYLNIASVIGLTSCTGALHLSLLAWGIGQGDEVITTPLSFCATSNAILQAGATPVFVDVEKSTGNIDCKRIKDKITNKTKAIMPVHLYGQMCDMKTIREISDQNNLIVIEDAAHCVEGSRDGVRPGELGDTACFSFYATKSITSGEGGALATRHKEKAEALKMLRHHGINKSAGDRYSQKYRHWDMPLFGWKYNMDNIQAALLIGQLGKIEEFLQKRDSIFNKYRKAFANVKSISLFEEIPGTKHGRHMFTMQVPADRRDKFLGDLQEKGIGIAVNYRPIHLLSYYRENFGYKKGDFPNAEVIGNRTVTLPLYPSLKNEEVEYIIDTVLKSV